jgi:digeranylgeranylglycerophospholipid reductase
VGLMTRQYPNLYLKGFLSFLKEQGKIDVNGDMPSYRGITVRPPARTYGERYIIVGDAAGQVKPITGGGIYFGLICAQIAVNNIKKVLNENDFRSVKLASYEKEWKRKLGKDISICRWAHNIYERLSDRQLDSVFNITTGFGIDKDLFSSDELDFDFHSKIIRKAIGFQTVSKLLSHEIAR